MWAVDIDGEVLINDTSEISVNFSKTYEIEITQLVGEQLLATIIREV
jgi:hypothetical protein